MSEKPDRNMDSIIAPQDRGFFRQLDDASELLEIPEQTAELLEGAKDVFRNSTKKERRIIIDNYHQALKGDQANESTKILIKEFLDWAESENNNFHGQTPELN